MASQVPGTDFMDPLETGCQNQHQIQTTVERMLLAGFMADIQQRKKAESSVECALTGLATNADGSSRLKLLTVAPSLFTNLVNHQLAP